MKTSTKSLRLAGGGLLAIGVLSIFQERLSIKVDASTMLILAVAVLLFCVGDLSNLSKFKFGDLEMEFGEKLGELENMITTEEVSPTSPNAIKTGNNINKGQLESKFYQAYEAIFNSSSSNLEKVLRASQLLEEMLLDVGKKLEMEPQQSRNASMVVNQLSRAGLLSPQEVSIYKEFSQIRNQIIHKDIGLLDDAVTVRMLDLILRMIRIFGF